MDKKKISVLMPVKNCEAFLNNAVRSIREQSYENIEFIIIDNGSSDSSWEIIMSHKASDKRIIALQNRNLGLTSCLNLMLGMARGEYIARIDADDVADPRRLEIQHDMLVDSDAIMSTGRCMVFDEEGNFLYEHGPNTDKTKLKWNLIFKNEIWHSSSMWKNGKGIKYNESYTYAQDYELWSRMCRRWDIVSTDRILCAIRKRSGSITFERRAEQEQFSILTSKKNMEYYLGREVTEENVKLMRLLHEGNSASSEIKSLYEELSEKFWSILNKRKPLKIRIGKKQKQEPQQLRLNSLDMEEKVKVSKRRWREAQKRYEGGKNYIWLGREARYAEVEICKYEISPSYGASTNENPWQGSCEKRPWEYQVTVAIPCLNTPETLPICIDLLRMQTLRPFIMIIDTGSTDKNLKLTEELRDEDVEVHSIRLNGVRHPSDYPAMAMDLAFSLCRTEYLFATHSDCFLRNRKVLENFMGLCKTKSPVVGYELSPRAHEDWVGMVSHTATMYHMPTMDQIGFGWSLRRLCNRYGIVDYKPDPNKPNWPDTEILGNYILRENSITPHLVGKEGNQCRTLDENIDHFRSYGAAKMYSPEYYPKVSEWYHLAKKEALARIERWTLGQDA